MAILPYNITVTDPADSKDMTVLATVKTELGISGSSDDAFLGVLIQQASGKAVELAGREFAAETMTEKFRIDHCDSVLQVSRRPISSVTSIEEDGNTLTEGTDFETISSTGWIQRIDSDGNLRAWSSSSPVTVVYVGGWVMLTELPHALERIVIDEVKRNYFERKRDPLVKSEEVPGVLARDFWVGGLPGNKDPMQQALEDAGFCETVI